MYYTGPVCLRVEYQVKLMTPELETHRYPSGIIMGELFNRRTLLLGRLSPLISVYADKYMHLPVPVNRLVSGHGRKAVTRDNRRLDLKQCAAPSIA